MAARKTVAAAKPKTKTTKTAERKSALDLPAKARTPAVAPQPTATVSPLPSQAAPKPEATPAPRTVPARAARDTLESGQAVIETYVTCGNIAAKGVESLSKEVVKIARASARAQFDLTEALVQAKTLQEAIEVQSAFTFESLDNMTAEWARLAGLSMGLTQEIMAPIQSRVRDHARDFWLPLAA